MKLVRTTMPGQPKPNGSGAQKVCDSCFANIPLDLERKNAPAMQAKYPELQECAALVKLGLTAADTVRQSCACLAFFVFDFLQRYGRLSFVHILLYFCSVHDIT